MKKSGFKLIKNVFSGVSALILTATTILSSSLVYGSGNSGTGTPGTPDPSDPIPIKFFPAVVGSADEKEGYTVVGTMDVTIQDAGYVFTDVVKRYKLKALNDDDAKAEALNVLDILGFIHNIGELSVAEGVKNEQYFRHADDQDKTKLHFSLRGLNYSSNPDNKGYLMKDSSIYFPSQFKVINKWSNEMTYVPSEKDEDGKYIEGFASGDHFTIESSSCRIEKISDVYYITMEWKLKGFFMTDGRVTHRGDDDIKGYTFLEVKKKDNK